MKLADPKQLKIVGELYCRLMEEILVRDEVIKNTLNGQTIQTDHMKHVPNSHETIAAEFCYLNLRMICELIALACLAAHGDIAEANSKKLREAWEADLIIKALTKLKPDFYPLPTRQNRNPLTGIYENKALADGFLTKTELLSLYREAGEALHRGSYVSLRANPPGPHTRLDRLNNAADRIWALLEHHEIVLRGGAYKIIGLMKSKKAGRPQFSFWKLDPGGLWRFQGEISPSPSPNPPASILLH